MLVQKINLNKIKSQELLTLCSVLKNHGEFKFVGGCVRDMLMHKTPYDIDIATDILPDQLIDILQSHHVNIIPIGINFGTVIARINQKHFEITTLRKDLECYGRKAKVAFTNDWHEDAARRDFTVNALYVDIEGNVTDFFHGLDDLANKVIKFIGNPQQRIQEDYLRILRYFRFNSYIGVYNIDYASLDAVTQLAEGLRTISGERIKNEMFKTLQGDFASEALALLLQSHIIDFISLQFLKNVSFPHLIFKDPLLNLAVVLKKAHTTSQDLESLCVRWRFSNAEKKHLKNLLYYQYTPEIGDDSKYHKREFYILQQSLFCDHIKMQATLDGSPKVIERAHTLIKESESWLYPNFPIKGEDLLHLGISGIHLGLIKDILLKEWIMSDFSHSKSILLTKAKTIRNG